MKKYEIVLGEKYEIVKKEILRAPAIFRWRLVHWTAAQNEIGKKTEIHYIAIALQNISAPHWTHWIELYLKGKRSLLREWRRGGGNETYQVQTSGQHSYYC